MNSITGLLTCAVAALMLYSSCGTVTENLANPSVTGMLVKADGTTPAAGAVVTLRKSDVTIPVLGSAKKTDASATALTDNDGVFSFDECTAGVYVIDGDDGTGNGVRIDSVIVNATGTTNVSRAVLKRTGAIRGRVALDNGADPSNVFVLALGSDKFAQVSQDGSFILKDLSYGRYILKIVCVLGVCGECIMAAVTVEPGDTVSVKDLVYPVKPICVPSNLRIAYDDRRCIVHLSWDGCDNGNGMGYAIFKYDTSSQDMFNEQPDYLVATGSGTTFDDTLLVNYRQYVYAVASVSTGGAVGERCNPTRIFTSLGGYDADTIHIVNGEGYIDGIRTMGNGTFFVAYSDGTTYLNIEQRFATLSETGTLIENEILRGKIPGNAIIHIDTENIYVHAQGDSMVYCFTLQGVLSYAVFIGKRQEDVLVVNDTLFAWHLDSTGTKIMECYDLQGNRLFSHLETYLRYANEYSGADGNLYTFGLHIDQSGDVWSLYSRSKSDGSLTLLHEFGNNVMEMISGFEAQKSRYIIKGYGFVVFDANFNIVSRCIYDHDQYLSSNETLISDNGMIAYVSEGKDIILLTPK